MAKDSFGTILTVGLLGGVGYFVYNWWTAQQQQTAAAASVAAPIVPPPYVYTPPTVQQQLQTAANANSFYTSQGNKLNAYQWSTLWNQIGQTAIPDVNAIFFPNGVPSDASQMPLLDLPTFMAGLSSKGISGFGGPDSRVINVPVMLTNRKLSMSIPAGTTRAQLQQMIRSRG